MCTVLKLMSKYILGLPFLVVSIAQDDRTNISLPFNRSGHLCRWWCVRWPLEINHLCFRFCWDKWKKNLDIELRRDFLSDRIALLLIQYWLGVESEQKAFRLSFHFLVDQTSVSPKCQTFNIEGKSLWCRFLFLSWNLRSKTTTLFSFQC